MSRLPQPGSDKGTWGDVLNDYLLQAHNSDGTLKADAVTSNTIAPNAITAAAIAPNSVTASQLASNSVTADNIITGSITTAQFAPSVQASLANADAAVSGTAPNATSTVPGLIQLTGQFGGTYSSPTVANGIITDAHITSGGLSQSKINGLTTTLSAKEPAITAGTSSQYLRGDKTFQTLDKTAVGLTNIDNVADINKPISTAVQTALSAKASVSQLSTVALTGSYNDLTNLPNLGGGGGAVTSVAGRTGVVTLTSSDVGLGNVNNTSDASKPISTATQTAINLKADVASTEVVIRYNSTAGTWPSRPIGAQWGVLYLSTNDATAPTPTDANLALGDRWLRNPNAS